MQIYFSPLKTLINCYKKTSKRLISNIEQILPFIALSWQISSSIKIHYSKPEVEKAYRRLLNIIFKKEDQFLIYIDGSSINRKTNAVAVRLTITWNIFLGPTHSFTVYFGEFYGILLATKMSLEIFIEPKVIIIYINSQATIRAIGSPKNKSEQHIVQCIVLAIYCLRQRESTVEIYRMPVYIGFCSNKTVDKSAKGATGWRLKKLRYRGIKEEDTLSTTVKTQQIKKLLFARKTQVIKNEMRE